jgi:hypothetical protein
VRLCSATRCRQSDRLVRLNQGLGQLSWLLLFQSLVCVARFELPCSALAVAHQATE